MFAKIPLQSISFWQIWVERRQERARYTVLGDVIFSHPYYSFPSGLLFSNCGKIRFSVLGFGKRGIKGVNSQSPKLPFSV